MTIRTAIHPLGAGAIPSFYEEGQVVFEKSTPGSYSLEILQKGTYKVWGIGAGGGGGGMYGVTAFYPENMVSVSGGCSGAGFIGLIYFDKGTYSLSVGAGGAGGKVDARDSSWPGGNIGSKGGNTSISSSGKSYLVANGGYGAYMDASMGGNTSVSTVSCPSYIGTPELKANGAWGPQNTSPTAAGGASVWNSKGAGGSASTPSTVNTGGNGYLKIQFME